MKNPIFGVAGAGAKDESLTMSRGRWHLLMSSPTGDPVHWRIASATSRDLVHWSKLDVWAPQGGVRDPSSPDVVQRPDGTYVVTYQAGPTSRPTAGRSRTTSSSTPTASGAWWAAPTTSTGPGSPITEYGGWGHARLGIARSTDLTH